MFVILLIEFLVPYLMIFISTPTTQKGQFGLSSDYSLRHRRRTQIYSAGSVISEFACQRHHQWH